MSDDLGGLTPFQFRRKLRLRAAIADTLSEFGTISDDDHEDLAERLTDAAWDSQLMTIGDNRELSRDLVNSVRGELNKLKDRP